MKKGLLKDENSNLKNIKTIWVMRNMFLLKCWTIFIYNMSHLNCKTVKRVIKIKGSVNKRWKISNYNTPIPF